MGRTLNTDAFKVVHEMMEHLKGMLDDFEALTDELHTALIELDAQRVSSVTALQTACLEEIQRQTLANPVARELVAQRLGAIQPLFARNRLLLHNAIDVNNQVIQIHMAQNHISYDHHG